MALEEKIGQLFMIAAYVDPEYGVCETGNPNVIQEIEEAIVDYHVGGLVFVGPSESVKQVHLTNHYQQIARYPLLIAQDLEWGLGMRLKDGLNFPKNITLGAVKNTQLIYEMGSIIGRKARGLGVHINLSPVLDVNSEPDNLAINIRSFGSCPNLVAEKGVAMIRGLQDAGIIASAKHFPGLGDVIIDPHFGLPCSWHDPADALYPFMEAIEAGVLSLQTEHFLIPSLEPDLSLPASLSQKVVTGLLREELQFDGLILSGALRMRALTENFSAEEIVLKAFLAGHDMLLMPADFKQAYCVLKQALSQGIISEEQIDARLLKILEMKQHVGLDLERFALMPGQLVTNAAKALKKQLYEEAVSLTRNQRQLLPLKSTQQRVAYVEIGTPNSEHFFHQLNEWLPLEKTYDNLDAYSKIIVAIYPQDPRRIEEIRLLGEEAQKVALKQFRVHGMSDQLIELIKNLQRYEHKTIVAYFGNPFGLHFFDHFSTLIMGYEDDPDAQLVAASLVKSVK